MSYGILLTAIPIEKKICDTAVDQISGCFTSIDKSHLPKYVCTPSMAPGNVNARINKMNNINTGIPIVT